MNFSKYINVDFNISHAVAWSIGFHIIFIGFFPSLELEPPIKLEKPNDQIRLKIKKKQPITLPQPKLLHRPLVLRQTIVTAPLKVNPDQVINVAIARKFSHAFKKAQNVTPFTVRLPSYHPSHRAANISKTELKDSVQNVRHHRKIFKDMPATNKQAFFKKSTRNVSAILVEAKLRDKVFQKKVFQLGGSARKIDERKYLKNTFFPELRKIQEIKIVKQKPASSSIEEELEELWGEYSNLVRMKIASAKTYPQISREQNHQGRTILSFKLGRDGNVLKVTLGSSSGHEALDRAAINAVNDAAPYPEIPKKLNRQYVLLRIPISFILN